MYGREEMISIFKQTKGGESDGGKRDTNEDASQNKAQAHDSNNIGPEASATATANGQKASAGAGEADGKAVAPQNDTASG